MERIKQNIPRVLIGAAIGAVLGLVFSQVSSALGSQCTIMCKPINAIILVGFMGIVAAIK